MNKKLTDKKYWQDKYNKTVFFKPNKSDSIRKFIIKFFNKNFNKKDVFEIGCFPGRYLSVFGDMGYILNGIDIIDKAKEDMKNWLWLNNYKIGDFFIDDFLAFKNNKKYKVVCSFGFIEHFENYKELILKHSFFVDKDGYLFIVVPNFSGKIQKFLHKFLDKESLENHYLPSMDPFIWRDFLNKIDFEVISFGWFGGFDFWGRGSSFLKKAIIKILNIFGKVLRLLPFNSKLFSPYAFILAKKK